MIVQNTLLSQDIPEKGMIDGHIRFTFTSAASADVMAVAMCANLAASLLFERLHAQGTNIVLSLRADGGKAEVVARNGNDGLSMEWPPKQADAKKLEDLRARISERLAPKAAPSPAPPREDGKRQQQAPGKDRADEPDDDDTDDDEEYLVKQITRIP